MNHIVINHTSKMRNSTIVAIAILIIALTTTAEAGPAAYAACVAACLAQTSVLWSVPIAGHATSTTLCLGHCAVLFGAPTI